MLSPIERMIDNCGLKCTVCGAGVGGCKCWNEQLERALVNELVNAIEKTPSFGGLLNHLEKIVIKYRQK